MLCLEALLRSLLHQPVQTLEQRYEAPIGVWSW